MFEIMSKAAAMAKSKFKIGDNVEVLKDESKVKQLQKNHGGWNKSMRLMLGQKGKVKGIHPDGDLRVKIMGNMVIINPQCLEKVEMISDSDDDVYGVMKVKKKKVVMMLGQGDSDDSDDSENSNDSDDSDDSENSNDSDDSDDSDDSNNGEMFAAAAMAKSKFKVGDKVRVLKDRRMVKQLQRGHGQWNKSMLLILGEKGKVKRINADGDLRVNIMGNIILLNPKCVKKVEMSCDFNDDVPGTMYMKKRVTVMPSQDDSDDSVYSDDGEVFAAAAMAKSKFKVGDKVKVLKDRGKVKQLQKGHGLWNKSMRLILGEKGKVQNIICTGDLRVKIMGNTITLNPKCVKKVETSSHSDGELPDAMKMMKQMAKILSQNDLNETVNKDEEISDMLNMKHMRFFAAIKSGDIEQAKALVDLVGPNISMKKTIPLIVSVREGHEKIVEFLLSKGAEVNAKDSDGDSSLHIAVQKNHLKICKILTSKGANVNAQNKVKLTPVMLATIMGSQDILKYLVSVKGVDLNIGDKDKDTALHLAIHNSQLNSVEILFEAGASIEALNKRQFSSYQMAAITGHEKILEVFLKKVGSSIVDLQKEDKFAAIHLAAMNNHPGCMKMLIRYSADLNIRNSKLQTALHIAVSQKYLECVKILVENKAEMNLKDDNGDTPLHNGVRAQNMDQMKKMGSLLGVFKLKEGVKRDLDSPKEIVMYLAQKGAKLDIKNNLNKTAITACDDDTLKAMLMSVKEKGMHKEPAATIKDAPKDDPTLSELDQLKQKIEELEEEILCHICLDRKIDCTFGCGHVSCKVCAKNLYVCHMCRSPIKDVIKIFR